MSEPLLLQRLEAVAIISINDAPFNRMSLGFIDALEELVGQQAPLGGQVRQQDQIGMTVHVDEAGGHDQARGIDFGHGVDRLPPRADSDDASVAHRHVGLPGRLAAAVDDPPASDDKVVLGACRRTVGSAPAQGEEHGQNDRCRSPESGGHGCL